jgi:hypothetical protein
MNGGIVARTRACDAPLEGACSGEGYRRVVTAPVRRTVFLAILSNPLRKPGFGLV